MQEVLEPRELVVTVFLGNGVSSERRYGTTLKVKYQTTPSYFLLGSVAAAVTMPMQMPNKRHTQNNESLGLKMF